MTPALTVILFLTEMVLGGTIGLIVSLAVVIDIQVVTSSCLWAGIVFSSFAYGSCPAACALRQGCISG